MDVIFDIDGTLANNQHRQHHLDKKPQDWAGFQAEAHLDTVFEPIADIARILATAENNVILCTGRSEDERAVTEQWLQDNRIYCDRLYMRASKDYRPDDVIKGELLDQMIAEGFDPKMAFDDRDRVVSLWRRRGLICAQVAEGAF